MSEFGEITTDHEEIKQADLNIDNKLRSNLFAWNGQFSPQFIETLLSKYSRPGDIIFDPFLGSGTTLYEAARKQLSAFGVELNISAYYMAKIYEMVNIKQEDRVAIVQKIDAWMCLLSFEKQDLLLDTILARMSELNGTFEYNILSTLIILCDFFKNEISVDLLEKKWNHLRQIIIDLPYSDKPIEAINGDSRVIQKSDDAATLLITSPPYINVFNYHQRYRRSVEALGYDVLEIAKRELGANRKNRGNRLLTVIQYCIDMALAIKESSRICVPGARLIYVVGRESSVLGYSFCNSKLIFEICTQLLNFNFLLKQERVFKNRFGQMIYEDILHFENVKTCNSLNEEYILEAARKIALDNLSSKLAEDNKNKELLVAAINKAITVMPS